MGRNTRQEDHLSHSELYLPVETHGTRRHFRSGEVIYTQGEHADAIYLLERGRLKLTAVSQAGRQATISLLTPGMFFGESCLANVRRRRASATALCECVVIRINAAQFLRLVHQQQPLSDWFISQLVRRNARYEEDLLDQLFNCSERRLARTLLLLAHFDEGQGNEKTVNGVTQQILAEMVGTTRAHISIFMSRFRRLGFVDYDRRTIRVHASLITRLLSD